MNKFSVVLPAYNVEKYIGEALHGLLEQSYEDFEVIIVDDKATDQTGVIADSFADEFQKKNIPYQVIHKPENQGVSLARNDGMAIAKGEYVLFLDPDDWYDKNLLMEIAKAVEMECPDIVFYGYDEDYYLPDGTMDYSKQLLPENGVLDGDKLHKEIVKWERDTMFGYPWNKAYRLEFLREDQVEFQVITHIEDILFNIKAFEHANKVVAIDKALYHYRNQGQARLTGKYLSDYFALQKKRIQAFIDLQKEWDNLNQETMEVMAAFYFRSFQSALMRELEAGKKFSEVVTFAKQESEDELYLLLQNYSCGNGKMAQLLYQPLKQGHFRTAVRRGAEIGFVKRSFPRIFARIKQNR